MKNNRTYRDIGITIAATAVIVTVCTIAIFGFPTNSQKTKLPEFEPITVDTTEDTNLLISDYEPPAIVSAKDTASTDTALNKTTINTDSI